MIVKVKEFQEVCKNILSAVDTTTTNATENETVELSGAGKVLTMSVTNKEYFVTAKSPTLSDDELFASVDAKLFLTLISKITTDELELSVEGNALIVKGNGTYKLPMKCDEYGLVKLKPITIGTVTSNFTINSDVLLSIINYNSRILQRDNEPSTAIQNMYYVDEKGAITFKQGACVNQFDLEQPIKLLLVEKLVRLFKLFKKNSNINFTYGFDMVNGEMRAKAMFNNDTISITSFLKDDNLKTSVPVDVIRGLANNPYPHTVSIERAKLLEVVGRLTLFKFKKTKLVFENSALVISSMRNEVVEKLSYANSNVEEPYTMYLNINDLLATLEGCNEEYLTLHFGNGRAVVIARANVKNVMPERSDKEE